MLSPIPPLADVNAMPNKATHCCSARPTKINPAAAKITATNILTLNSNKVIKTIDFIKLKRFSAFLQINYNFELKLTLPKTAQRASETSQVKKVLYQLEG